MVNENEVPAIPGVLPELLPVLNAMGRVLPTERFIQLQKLLTDCSDLLMSGNNGYDNFSLLTPGGYPMEFTFRCDTDVLCITTETGPSNNDFTARLKWAQQYSGDFSFHQYPALERFSDATEQCYGCWLGIRNKGAENIYKLYHEVAPSRTPFFFEHLVLLTGIHQLPDLVPMMVGFTPGINGIAEFYCRVPKPSMHVLGQLFSIAGIAGELNMLVDYLCWLGGVNRQGLFSAIRFGVSFQAIPGQTPGITIFVHAAQLCRPNIDMRSRLIKFAQQLGYQMPFYKSVSEWLLINDPVFPVHGMISLKPQVKRNMLFTVGLRPW